MLEPDPTLLHEQFMRMALAEAAAAMDAEEVPIGAVIVHRGKVIARSHNQREQLRDPTAHAEMIAITQAAESRRDWRLDDCTLYATLDQLAKKGLLVKRVGRPMSTRGGRRKIYHQISRGGIEALQAACELQQSLWEGVTPASLAKG